MNLLIVEDDKIAIQTYKDNIELFNKDKSFTIVPDIKEDLKIAREALKANNYDAAIIDLKLSPNIDLEGMEIVDEIRNYLRFPIFIVSGSIGQVSYEENVFLKKRSRDSDFQQLLKEIVAIYDTGITNILGKSGQIDKYLNKIFWDHLSNSLDVWINDKNRNPVEKERSLLRYTLLHIQEYLELTEASNFEEYVPAEIYIIPPIKEQIFTGDLLNDKDGDRYIVLTPSCDLAHEGKTDSILLIKIENHEIEIAELKSTIRANESNRKVNEAKSSLKSLISNKKNKYHFLPKYKNLEEGLINFHNLKTVTKKTVREDYLRIASLNSNFVKDIIARFSYYYSRQGSPDFNIDEILDSIISE
ncbi:MAG: hypothetical protein JXR82_12810 [Marinifilaceae bacterium]|nr:hypothetical protein [Marinifilaceae bacterium]